MADAEEKAKVNESGHGSTLFISNLPYTATSVDLQTLFSDFAPVRSAFVVTEQGSGVSKGVGYVSFALGEDAQSTFEAIAKDGISLVGRALRVQWAENKKPRDKLDSSESPKKEVKPKAPRQHQPRPVQDASAIRTIVVSGLPRSIDSKVLWKKIRKYDGAEKLDWPVKIDSGEEDPSTAHVLFGTPSQAATAINKLHAHVYKGSLLSVALKKRLDNLSKPSTLLNAKPTAEPLEKKKAKSSVAAPSHSSRLIVRNIPFEVTEQDIRATFLPYGPIYSIHIPMDLQPALTSTAEQVKDADPESSAIASAYSAARKPRTKGFAFVWMLSKKDAERAMEGCNGTVMRAGSAKKMADDKQKKKKEKRLEEKKLKEASKAKKVEGEDELGEDVDMEDVDVERGDKTTEKEKEKEDDDMRAKERVIAVDWALSKDRWEGEKAKIEAVQEDEDEGVEMSGSSSDDTSDLDSDSEDEDNIGVHEGDFEGEDDDERDDNEVKVKPELPPPEQGTTVFVRNVPFDATEEELRTLFRSFGPLRYARITLDPATGRSRGTGFACFWNKDDADRAVQQSELLRLETTGRPSATAAKKNPFSLPSILTPDPSSSLAQSLVLHGRTLDVVTAVTRDVAGKLKDFNERARQKEDKRNMYLLREGVILPNSPAAVDLPGIEVERRTTSFNARRTLLKSNPSLYISKTRLSVRQIPTFVTERMLRRLVGHGVKKFEEEVKAGQREALTEDERTADSSHIGDKEDEETKPKTKSKADKSKAKRPGLTRQAKIVRQAERIDGLTGKGKSKGYGFLEMQKHADALRFLRWANCNPEVVVLLKEWWKDEVELLVEDEKKRGKEKAKVEENNGIEGDEMRLKRLKEELDRVKDEGDGGLAKKARSGLLIVEFSIENVQVVQRRNARQKEGDKTPTDSHPKTKDRKRKRDTDTEMADAQPVDSPPKKTSPHKKSRLVDTPEIPAKVEDSLKSKTSNPIGSIIGRKRKERKSGRKS
ncbi:hypothetical protein CPB83DRAFT_856641 [Crepidotus variabilis]|uniref:RRM domain-containing protein n=1 Tax=Crepidotus variabilis TaxID=179855 RepID=A0A9P6EDU8_9AGAR|nr:hypothetical protein CPB83DRAFT_856641 [Crepidotus variabilis]